MTTGTFRPGGRVVVVVAIIHVRTEPLTLQEAAYYALKLVKFTSVASAADVLLNINREHVFQQDLSSSRAGRQQNRIVNLSHACRSMPSFRDEQRECEERPRRRQR